MRAQKSSADCGLRIGEPGELLDEAACRAGETVTQTQIRLAQGTDAVFLAEAVDFYDGLGHGGGEWSSCQGCANMSSAETTEMVSLAGKERCPG